MMAERRLLEPIAHELQRHADAKVWRSLAALDAYRRRFEDIPDTLTNPILLGSLLIPLGYSLRSLLPAPSGGQRRPSQGTAAVDRECCRWRGATSSACDRFWRCSSV